MFVPRDAFDTFLSISVFVSPFVFSFFLSRIISSHLCVFVELTVTRTLCVCRHSVQCLVPCLCCCRDPGLCWCFPCRSCSSEDFWSGMGSDGFQTQRRGSWILGKERAEKVLADAVLIYGREQWICKFCSECRRCYTNKPSRVGGVSNGRQGGQGLPPEWTLRTRSRAGRSWMSKAKSCRKICGKLKNCRVCRNRFRKASKMFCSSSCRRWRKAGMTSRQSNKKCRKITKDTKHPG